MPLHGRNFGSLTHLNPEGGKLEKRGPKGHFQGSRKEYLGSQLPFYTATKKGNRQIFWHNFWSGWWEHFPWKLPDDKEPPVDNPKKMGELASAGLDEKKFKSEVEAHLSDVHQILIFPWPR